MSRHKPNPHAAWDRDHLRPKTSSTRPSASASTLASTRTRLPSPRSISIMPTFRPVDRTGGGGVCAKGAGRTLDGKDGDTASWTGIRRGAAGIASPSTLASFRQAKISPRETPCLRATSETFAPAVKLSSMIRAFSSSDQRRRRSTPFKISTGTGVYLILRTSLRSYLRRSAKTDKAVKIGCIPIKCSAKMLVGPFAESVRPVGGTDPTALLPPADTPLRVRPHPRRTLVKDLTCESLCQAR